jgi:hypothetical protein
VIANHGEEDEIYPHTIIEIAEAQREDQELKVYFKKMHQNQKRMYIFILLRTQKCYARMAN